MTEINFKTQKFAVIGLGDSGLSIVKYLEYQKADILKIFDTRDNPPNQEKVKNIPIVCGKLVAKQFVEIDVIVISPGISIFDVVIKELIQQGKIVVGDIELFARAIRQWSSKVIGITGSNGKTTVTTLVGYLAKNIGMDVLVAGNIGLPVLDCYLEIQKTQKYPELIVLELSSFQLESTKSLYLDSATVLNISEDHLDRYRDLLEYAYCKSSIFNHAKVQVLNTLDELCIAMKRAEAKQIRVGWADCDYNLIDNKIYYGNSKIVDCGLLKLIGRHNYFNVMASLALLDGAGIAIGDEKLLASLYQFGGLVHRMQVVRKFEGITFIEDSKGTNVGAVIAGVSGLSGKVHLILGGDGKGQDFLPLKALVENKCTSVAVIGQDKEQILRVLEGVKIPVDKFDTLEDAVKFCYNNALSGDNVVLSPACASWDMFDNYKHRAEVFVNCVNLLISGDVK